MSRTSTAKAHVPQRKRGHLRVAAILDAGAAMFAEKGYAAVTMTEIAARSGTAFGSLYRFFPSKEALAIALLQHYAQSAIEGLAALEERASQRSTDDLADGLVDYMLALSSDRRSAIAVLEAWGIRSDALAQFQERQREGMARLLRTAFPRLTPARSRAMAFALLHVLKGVAVLARKERNVRRPLVAEYRGMVRSYLGAVGPKPRKR